MDALRAKVEGGGRLDKHELKALLEALGLVCSGDSSSPALAELLKSYKLVPASLRNYLELNVQSKCAKGYSFFGDEEIARQVEELFINNTWNTHFMPLGALTSLQ